MSASGVISAPHSRGLRKNRSASSEALSWQRDDVISANRTGQEDLESQLETDVVVPGDDSFTSTNENVGRVVEAADSNSIDTEGVLLKTTELVEARPVEDELDVVQTGVIMVDPEELEREAVKKRKEKECQRIGAGLIFVSILVITLSVFFSRSSDGPERTGMPTVTPSLLPSSFPSMARTRVLDSFVTDHLQPYSQEAIWETPNSPQARAYNWLKEHPEFPHYAVWRQKQLFALATFFYSFEGPH